MSMSALRSPFCQILAAIACGIVLGLCKPALALAMQPLGAVFISVIKLMVAPLIFFTVSGGIAGIGKLKQLGRIGIKALLYFEALSFLSLMSGIVAALLLRPGAGFHIDAGTPAGAMAAPTIGAAIGDAFMHSPLLLALMLALAAGMLLALLGERGRRPAGWCDRAAGALLAGLRIVLRAAPLAAFGAVAWSVGKYGLVSVAPLLKLMAALYLATALFVLLVLGAIGRACGFSVLRFIAYIKEELLIVFGTASSITAMAPLMEKMARAGCPAQVTGLVIPAGYSFNLNGSNLYLGMALVFLAQAQGISLGTAHLLSIMALAMITSKGASGVAGSAFVALAATLAAVPEIPVSSLLFIVGIERLLKCRPLANLAGNGVACLAIAAWDRQLDRAKLRSCGLAR
ncbi:cation:dicarboxylate symporter family transporter [Janthinobacterium agaricidamnosum]|nr:cation:dicarboxylase symporter family transporter [Janthinobacterium agaricidamnosum]